MTAGQQLPAGFEERSARLRRELTPVLEGFEGRRKQCVKRLVFVVCGAVILAVVAAAIALGYQASPNVLVFVGFGAVALAGVGYTWVTSDYKADFKRQVIPRVVEAYLPGLRYTAHGVVGESKFRASGIFNRRMDRYRGEDHIAGRLDKTDFEFSEVHAEYKTQTRTRKGGTRTTYHTIFKGVFFIADFHKEFRTRTLVLPDTLERTFGFLGQKLQSWNFTRGELIKLEDPEFEREFCVYGDDQVEARYILSPSLMRRILTYKQKFGGSIYLSFLHSKVYVALSTGKNHFEARLFDPVNDFGLVQEYLRDLDLIVDIVEDLNLNTRIWTKA